MLDNLRISPSPHVHSKLSTQKVMANVLIALLPATIGSVYFFGASAFLVITVSIVSAILAEFLWQKITKQRISVMDLSAAVTGLLLAMNLPSTAPLWMPAVGSFFAIILVKQLFGGLGHNFMNPALAARAILMASWPQRMTNFISISDVGIADAVSSPTPLAILKTGEGISGLNLMDLFIGNVGGCLGETSAVLLLIGGLYLIATKLINARIPVAMLGTMAIFAFLFGGEAGFMSGNLITVAVHLCAGGAMLGAFFMATDYATTPVTPKGQWVFGIGCGLLTMIIRLWGGYNEGVSYSILIMNVAAPLIEKFTMPKPFGSEVKKVA